MSPTWKGCAVFFGGELEGNAVENWEKHVFSRKIEGKFHVTIDSKRNGWEIHWFTMGFCQGNLYETSQTPRWRLVAGNSQPETTVFLRMVFKWYRPDMWFLAKEKLDNFGIILEYVVSIYCTVTGLHRLMGKHGLSALICSKNVESIHSENSYRFIHDIEYLAGGVSQSRERKPITRHQLNPSRYQVDVGCWWLNDSIFLLWWPAALIQIVTNESSWHLMAICNLQFP